MPEKSTKGLVMKLKNRENGSILKIDNDSVELDHRGGKIHIIFKDEQKRRWVKDLNEIMSKYELCHDEIQTGAEKPAYEVVAAILYAGVINAANREER